MRDILLTPTTATRHAMAQKGLPTCQEHGHNQGAQPWHCHIGVSGNDEGASAGAQSSSQASPRLLR